MLMDVVWEENCLHQGFSALLELSSMMDALYSEMVTRASTPHSKKTKFLS